MAPHGDRNNGIHAGEDALSAEHDPYIVSLVRATRQPRPDRMSENAAIVFDELQSSSLRRRTDLLSSGH